MQEGRVQRKLAAILAADVVGYSRMIGDDEVGTLARLKAVRVDPIDRIVAAYHGRIVKEVGDGFLVEFASVVDAVQCAADIQTALASTQAEETGEPICFRIGVNVGDLVVEGDDLFGDGVNVASRLEGLADPGGVCISGNAFEQVRQRLDLSFEDMGPQSLKNIATPVPAYRLVEGNAPAGRRVAQKRTRRRLVAALGLGAAVLISGLLAYTQMFRADDGTVSDLPKIAVMAFEDQSPGPDQGYLSDAISDGIINELSKFTVFQTIARNSSFAFRGKDGGIKSIREALGADYILEGSQQKIDEQLVVTAQLIDSNTEANIWTERFEGEVAQLFEFQGEIIRQVASTVGGRLAVYPGLTGDRDTVTAMNLAAQGLKLFRRSGMATKEKARPFFEAAIEADPNAAIGYRAMGFYYRNIATHAVDASEREQAALDARLMANKALELAPDDYLTHYLLGHLHVLAGDISLAQAKYEKTKELNPSFSNAFVGGSTVRIYLGDVKGAIADIEHAMKIDPLHPDWFHGQLAWAYWAAGDCKAADASFRNMTRVPPVTQKNWAAVLACLGDQERAQDAMETYLKARPGATLTSEKEHIEDVWVSGRQQQRWLDDLRTAGMPE